MNVYELAAKIFLKNLDVKYVTDDKRKHVAGLATDAIASAKIFMQAVQDDQPQVKIVVVPKEEQLELPFPESEL